jgi:hypothetical protein
VAQERTFFAGIAGEGVGGGGTEMAPAQRGAGGVKTRSDGGELEEIVERLARTSKQLLLRSDCGAIRIRNTVQRLPLARLERE